MEFSDLKPEEVEKASNMIKAISHPMRLAILGHLGDGHLVHPLLVPARADQVADLDRLMVQVPLC